MTGSGSDKLDLYYAADAGSPVWTYLTTITATVAGQQTLSTTYTLPTGALQAVRARFRYGGTETPCQAGFYTDHDDLAFATQDAPAPIPLTVTVTGVEGGRGTITVTPPPLGPTPPACSNLDGANMSCTFLYPPDTVVSLSRIAEPDSKFLGWSGACTGEGVCDLALSGPGPGPTVDAVFLGPRSLTVNVTGSRRAGGARSPSRLRRWGRRRRRARTWEGRRPRAARSCIRRTRWSRSAASPSPTRSSWAGRVRARARVSCDLPLSGPGPGPTVDALFLGPRSLTVTVTGSGGRAGHDHRHASAAGAGAAGVLELGGAPTESCTFLFPPDTVVSLGRSAEPDSKFLGWSGVCAGEGPCDCNSVRAGAGTNRGRGVPGTTVAHGDGDGSGGRAGHDRRHCLQPLGPTPPACCETWEGRRPQSCNFLFPPDTVVSLSRSRRARLEVPGLVGCVLG